MSIIFENDIKTVFKSDTELIEILKEKASAIVIEEPVVETKKKNTSSESEDDEEEEELEEDEDGNVIRNDEEIMLDDEIDDTYGDAPEGYVTHDIPIYFDSDELPKETPVVKEIKKESVKDDWGF
jgi:hypothetical protein